MINQEILSLLKEVQAGHVSPEAALEQIQVLPYTDLGFAKIDHHRKVRKGVAEVIYGEGKTAQQVCGILEDMEKNGETSVLITRLSPEKAEEIQRRFPLTYHSVCRIALWGEPAPDTGNGTIVVCSGGTSDMPVSEEAAVVAQALGNKVIRLYDVGVAGIHRLLSHTDILASATVVIAVAGMEGALASVVGGLVDCPVIAVPTSVGYGSAFGGITALLSMLNSCSSGISVVNIDNGFGAAYVANMINHSRVKKP